MTAAPAPVPPRFGSAPAAVAWFARHRPDATAVVEAGRSVSYAALAVDVADRARDLARLGIGPHRLVGLEIRPERYLSLVLLLACEALHATVAPLSLPDIRPDDPVTRRCDLLLLRGSPKAQNLPPVHILTDTPLAAMRRPVPSDEDLQLLSQPAHPDMIARISRTSGTTGQPKLIPTSFEIQRRMVESKFDYIRDLIQPPIVFLCIYNVGIRDIHHRMLAVLEAGGTVLLAKEPDVPLLLAAGVANHINLMAGDAERVALATPPSAHVGSIAAGLTGARVSPALRQLVVERLGRYIELAYASNETNRICVVGDDGVGTLVRGASVRIVDEAGVEVPMGQTGIIQARTRTMVDGYFDDPAATAAAFIDGWYHTRDAGFVPEPGRLVILGRADDMLNIGGIKLAPHLIEDELRAVVGITDAALVAGSSPTGSNTLIVTVEPAATLSAEAEAEIRSIVGRHVRDFELFPLPSFPRTETGKVRRGEIEAAFRRRQGQ